MANRLGPEALIARGNIPRHVAIIMDGNGRWAKARGVPRVMGHRAAREAVREAVRGCTALGVEVLTLYTFSVENWQRPAREVSALMTILRQTLRAEARELHANNVRLQVIGRIDDLPAVVRETIAETQAMLADNTGLQLNLALSYSGRAEIVDAVRTLMKDVREMELDPAKVAVEKEKQMAEARKSGKPENIIEKMVEGKMRTFYNNEGVLVAQPFAKDDSKTVAQALAASGLTATGFIRWRLGKP